MGEVVCARGVPVLLLFLAGVASEVDVDVEEEPIALQHKMKRGRVREVRKLEWERLGPNERGGDAGAHRN